MELIAVIFRTTAGVGMISASLGGNLWILYLAYTFLSTR
jgi:hypothetical protein